jgi:ribosomal protein L11 methyltransferase
LQSILFRAGVSGNDALLAELWEHGTTGVLEEGNALRAFFDDDADLGALLHAHADQIEERRHEEPVDLQHFERDGWEGILVGERFFVSPPWIAGPLPPGRVHLAIDTSLAFGTGRHESTQLALEALETYLTPGATVVDVGCGSGILSLAAALLGAGRVISCDLDPHAVASTRARLPSPVFQGSADALRSASADLVLANITPRVLDALAYDLNRITKPDGLLVLAGFLRDNPPRHWNPQHTRERGDWMLWTCRPDTSQPPPARPYEPDSNWW